MTPQPATPAPPASGTEPEEALAALGSDDHAARRRAAARLEAAGAAAVPLLLAALGEREERVRNGAAEVLGALREPAAAEPLVGLFAGSRVRWDALRKALVRIGPPAAPFLLEAIREHDPLVRKRAVIVMANQKDRAFTEPLVEVLNRDRSTGVRVTIAWAHGRIRDREACEALLDALHDWWGYVRKGAGEALEEITGQKLGWDEIAWRRWWRDNGDDFLASARTPGQDSDPP